MAQCYLGNQDPQGIDNKADKQIPSAENNVALLDSAGNLVDSGKSLQDINYIRLGTSTISSDADLLQVIEEMYATMSDTSGKHIYATIANSGTSLLGGSWFGEIVRSTINYGYVKLTRYGANNNPISVQLGKSAGTWLTEFEWENPPLALDTEYRTTERYNGSAVYACRVGRNSVTKGGSWGSDGSLITTIFPLPSAASEIVSVTGRWGRYPGTFHHMSNTNYHCVNIQNGDSALQVNYASTYDVTPVVFTVRYTK